MIVNGEFNGSNGYIYEICLMPNGCTKLIAQHKRVWLEYYGEVPKGWDIHHKNGIKTDNRISNLIALPSNIHSKFIHSNKMLYRILGFLALHIYPSFIYFSHLKTLYISHNGLKGILVARKGRG